MKIFYSYKSTSPLSLVNQIKMTSETDDFDRLPNDVVRLILNRIHDAKSLCACLAVSTRFNSLALHSTNLSLSVDRIHDSDDSDESEYHSASKYNNLLRSLFKFFIYKPLRFFTRLASSSSRTDSGAVFYSPAQALKSFSDIEILKIQLPSHRELQIEGAGYPLLKWKANFGSQLKTCVIVAAASVDQIQIVASPDSDVDNKDRGGDGFEAERCGNNKLEEQHHRSRGLERAEALAPPPPPPSPPFAISNEDLKTRVVWTISCLIAASSRHSLLKRIVSTHQKLKSIEIVDQHRQGTLTMEEADITQLRMTLTNSDLRSSNEAEGERSRIPALKMKMWHAAELELPGCKKVMKRATLLVIGAVDGVGVGVGEGVVFGEEEEMMYGEAAREIRRKMKRSYSLEMESF